MFEEFGCKINFDEARRAARPMLIEREDADFKWRRDGYSIKELVNRGCYKTRGWRRGTH